MWTRIYPNVFSYLTSRNEYSPRSYDDNETIYLEPKFCHNYYCIDMEQLRSDIYAWYDIADPENQIQYFNAIIMWLFELQAPFHRYIIGTDLTPWFTFDVAYRVWKRRKTVADKTRYKESTIWCVRTREEYMKRFLGPNHPAKKL
jgi:hypothetical protein